MHSIRDLLPILTIAGLLAAATGARAQTTQGTLTGTIADAQGGVLPGATVVAVYAPTGARSETITRADGHYVLSGLRPGGPYSITASLPGFRAATAELTVVAGGEQRQNFTMGIAGVSEVLTVRGGTEIAHDRKRSAPNITDIVSADAVGRFPDANAAEALRRIPGVSLEIDQGEGRFVVVRGIDATLNNVTINGQIMGTPAEFGTRGVSMDSVPADLISRLEVTKAVTPDMDANAIGGTINIVTLGDRYRVVDVKISAPIARGLRGLFEVSNLTDQHRWAYSGVSDRRTADERYSWSLYAGLDWRLR